MDKTGRRKLHAAINNLSHDELAAIVRRTYQLKAGQDTNTIAKRVIAAAHRQVSPRQSKIPRG
jgi:hypothetical protein